MDDEDPRIDELDREIARLRARVAELEAIEQEAHDQYEMLRAQIAELEGTVTLRDKQVAALTDTAQRFQTRVAELQAQDHRWAQANATQMVRITELEAIEQRAIRIRDHGLTEEARGDAAYILGEE
jgi:chromosome segregation ATPase